MSLVDPTYFVRDIALPSGKYDNIQDYIDRYENEIIMELFGYSLGSLILDYDPGTSEQRIKDIVEGKEYNTTQYDGYYPNGGEITVKWNGLLNEEKKSLIAYYVYCRFLEENISHVTGVGGGKSALENAERGGLAPKYVKAQNKMMELYGDFYELNKYPESCFNFMYEHKETYPEWVFTEKEKVNRFGI